MTLISHRRPPELELAPFKSKPINYCANPLHCFTREELKDFILEQPEHQPIGTGNMWNADCGCLLVQFAKHKGIDGPFGCSTSGVCSSSMGRTVSDDILGGVTSDDRRFAARLVLTLIGDRCIDTFGKLRKEAETKGFLTI